MNPSPDTTPSASRQTYALSLGGVIALVIYFWFNSKAPSPIHLWLGLLMAVLAILPSLLWLRRALGTLPVFEVLMITNLNTYALPLLNGHSDLVRYEFADITTAALAVIAFQVAAIVVHEWTSGTPRLGQFWRQDLVGEEAGRWIIYGMALNTVYISVSTFTTLVPVALEGLLRAIFFGIGIISTFIAARRLGSGLLARGDQVFFFTSIAVQCLAMMATLFLVGAISLLLLSVIGYVSSRHRLPVLACVAGLFVLAILHNGKASMRAKYWNEGNQAIPHIAQLPAFYSEWFRAGLRQNDSGDESRISSKLIDRTSLFHMICLVVSMTPSQQPYLHGETYADIPAQFVPRLFWANKPTGHVSTSRLSVYYGLQTEEETERTTIGFGMLTEAYANFGFIGLVALGALFGFVFKKIHCWAADGPLLSAGGVFMVMLLAWSFQVEFTLSMWLASLYQACVAVIVLPLALRRFLFQ